MNLMRNAYIKGQILLVDLKDVEQEPRGVQPCSVLGKGRAIVAEKTTENQRMNEVLEFVKADEKRDCSNWAFGRANLH